VDPALPERGIDAWSACAHGGHPDDGTTPRAPVAGTRNNGRQELIMKRIAIAAFASLTTVAAGSATAAQTLPYNADAYPSMAQLQARDAAAARAGGVALQPSSRAEVRAGIAGVPYTGDVMIGDFGLKRHEAAASEHARSADVATAERAQARRDAGLPAGALRQLYAG
jgi:hypothetical protein